MDSSRQRVAESGTPQSLAPQASSRAPRPSPLIRQVAIARRRLNVERFAACLARSWCVWLSVALVAIVVRKLVPMAADERVWCAVSLGGAMAAGLLTAIAWTLLVRRGELEAAIEIDRRFGLKERVSSALALDDESRETPAGRALLDDATLRIERLDVGAKFRLSLDRSAWWPLVPGGLAILIALLISSRAPDNPAIATPTAPPSVQVKKTAENLRKKLQQRREEARKKGLTEADALLKKLEEGTRGLGAKAGADKEKALVKLNDLSKELATRRAQLAGKEPFQQQLNQLKDLKRGPADAAAEALRNGDLKRAAKALEGLRKKLAEGKLDAQQQKQLAQQMKQMADALKQAADAHQQAQQNVRQALDRAREQGDTQRAAELQRQLEKLQRQQAATEQLGELAEQCRQCADAMNQGNATAAKRALDQLQQQVSQMAESREEMQMLDQALDEIAQAKESMTASDAQQMKAGDGQMEIQGQRAHRNNQPGKGIGDGPGDRRLGAENATEAGFYDSHVGQRTGKGSATVTDLVDGPNKKGAVTEEIQDAFESAAHGNDDPLTDQHLPRGYREHAREYFDALRKGTR